MWLLAGVRPLRALRMSYRFTFFTLPTACVVSCCVGLFCLLVFFVCWFCLCLVLYFACAAGIFLTLVADVSR